MRELQVRKNSRRFFRSNVFAIILAVVSLLLLRSVWDVYNKNEIARINREEAQSKLDALEAKKKTLEFEIERLGTDRGVEEELRKRFQVSKQGEQVLIIIDKNDEVKSPVVVEQTLWQKIWTGLVVILNNE